MNPRRLSWLLDQIRADEDAAIAAGALREGRWHIGPGDDTDQLYQTRIPLDDPKRCQEGGQPNYCDDVLIASPDEDRTSLSVEIVAHMARWDPARVLASCAATRALLEEHSPNYDGGDRDHKGGWCRSCDDGYQRALAWPCDVAFFIAAGYRLADGYTEHWGNTRWQHHCPED